MSYQVSSNPEIDVPAKPKRRLYPNNIVDFETWMPPRKRAKTEEEKEIRKLQRVLRNRRSSRQSRDKKQRYVSMLEKHCSLMRQIIEELRYKLNIGSLISEKETWNAYLELQKHDFLSASPSDVMTATSNNDAGSTSRLNAKQNNVSTTGEEVKTPPESSLGEKIQIGTKLDSSEVQNTVVRSIEQIYPSNYSCSAKSILPYIHSPDCESDSCKNTIAESTPVSLGTSISENFNNKSTREGFVSNTMMPWFLFPPECQSPNLNFNNNYFILGDIEDTHTNVEKLKNKDQCDHNALWKGSY
ncbi:hypothetical protein RNJ44_02590 [Nakaseomyces bracarensis]|uniref:BZIP domain-containing protein n=1 Tax=Nakaseomyces bracarensis TaxID=273131 RepID=A0ABR4NM57_9SACH